MIQGTTELFREDGSSIRSDEDHESDCAAWDDVTGAPSDPVEVQRARKLEIDYARRKKVWRKIPRAEAIRRGWKVIKVRWIDINEGDAKHPISQYTGADW